MMFCDFDVASPISSPFPNSQGCCFFAFEPKGSSCDTFSFSTSKVFLEILFFGDVFSSPTDGFRNPIPNHLGYKKPVVNN